MAKILIKFPTRSRTKIFRETLAAWINNLSGKNDVRFLVAIDEDDGAMNAKSILSKLRRLKNVEVRVSPAAGNKVEAINRHIVDASVGADIVIAAADDFVPVVMGYDEIIVESFAKTFPDYDGAIWFDDGRQKSICTLPVIGAPIVRRWGFIYHPSYLSVYCDNEYTDVLNGQSKLARVNSLVIEHRWDMTDIDGKPDALKTRNENKELYAADKANYDRRRADGFPGYEMATEQSPPEGKSAMMPVADALDSLIIQQEEDRAPRIIATDRIPRISVLLERGKCAKFHQGAINALMPFVRSNSLQLVEGTDRKSMMMSATGHHVVIIPTDVWGIYPEYAELIVSKLSGNPDVISVVADGAMTGTLEVPWHRKTMLAGDGDTESAAMRSASIRRVSGPTPTVMQFSIEYVYPNRHEDGTKIIYDRMFPTFLCPTRREIILEVQEHIDLLANPAHPGSRDDLMRWASMLASSQLVRVENRQHKSCYAQIG